MKRFNLLLAFLFLIGMFVVHAQTTINGTVLDDNGEAVPGANIRAKGYSDVGTISDLNGAYTLSVPAEATTLVFSFVGMQTREVEISGQTTINVTLQNEDVGIDEVVVTGFGIKREKRSVTYQTEKVSSENLLAGQATRTAEGLVGKVAGLQINIQDNGVNPNSQILLRGLRSISSNNEALIVIDGALTSSGAFDDLNANDIESINVLKGASASALYGSGAANGVIIVETKTGNKAKAFRVGISNVTTFEKVAYMPHFQSEYGSGAGTYDNIENMNYGPRFDGVMRQIGPTFADGSYQEVPYSPVKDNLKDFYNTGTTLQNTVYLSGGDETGNFYMSFGNQNTKGIVPDDIYKRNTVRVNASKKIGKLELKLNSSYLQDETDVVGDDIGDQDRSFYWFILNTPANIPLTNYKDWDNPESYGYADNYFNAYYQNPYWAIGTNRDNDKTGRLTANVSASWDIIENINFTGRFGVNTVSGTGKNWRAFQEYDDVLQPFHQTVSSFVEDTEFKSTSYTGDALLTGNFEFATDFTLKAILGAAVYSYRYRFSEIRANNLSIPDFYDISNGTGQLVGTVNESEKRTFGFFTDLTLGYKNWAFLSLAGRQDFTSTLAKGNNSYFYPAVGLSVVLTDAIPALNDNAILSDAKITVSNAIAYNDLAPYQINERYYLATDRTYGQASSFPFGSINGFYQSNTTVDSEIKKEKLNSTEIGANLSFFKNRVFLNATYFLTTTTDLITRTTPSYSSGSTRYLTNIGKLQGNGYEITLGGKVLQLGDFAWDMSLNFYQYETVVKEIKDDLKEIALDSYAAGYGTYAVVGLAFPQLKAAAYQRDSQGRVIVDPVSGNPLVGAIENMGKTTPDYIIGLNTSLNFKGFSLMATFDYRGGYVYYAQGSDIMEFTGRSMESVSSNRENFVWPNSVIETSDGVFTENTNIQTTDADRRFWQNRYNEIKENYVKDATAFKIRELALNYSLPANLLGSKKVIKKLTVGVVARNLFTYLPNQKYVFSDPEFRNTRVTDDVNGIGIGGYITSPPTRSFGFNINVEF